VFLSKFPILKTYNLPNISILKYYYQIPYMFLKNKKHASYSDTTFQNDIALLYLASDVTLNNYIQIACIPSTSSTSYPGINLDVYAAGWGLLSSSESTTPNLLYNVKLSTYSSAQCPYSGYYDDGMICAGNKK
jgi:trypsin